MKVRVSFDDGALGGGKSRIVFVIREWAAKTLTKPDKLTTERAKERERERATESQNHRTTEARITNHESPKCGSWGCLYDSVWLTKECSRKAQRHS